MRNPRSFLALCRHSWETLAALHNSRSSSVATLRAEKRARSSSNASIATAFGGQLWLGPRNRRQRCKAQLEEDARNYQLQLEREEQQLEQATIDRLLDESAALRRATTSAPTLRLSNHRRDRGEFSFGYRGRPVVEMGARGSRSDCSCRDRTLSVIEDNVRDSLFIFYISIRYTPHWRKGCLVNLIENAHSFEHRFSKATV
jgi:hypothetical protein